jgi:SSS family solute:Na+ symporter
MKTGLLVAVALYAGLLLVAGLISPRRFRDLESFFLASRRLGPAAIAFSLCAGWVGAASLLVSTDQAFREGLSAYWIIGLPAVATLLVFLPLVKAIRGLGGTTLSDIMEARYGAAARPVTTFLVVCYLAVLAASQMVAAGRFLQAFLGLSYPVSTALAAGPIVLALAAGGLASVIRSHAVQFFLLVAGVAALTGSLGQRSPWGAVITQASRLGKTDYFDFLAHADRNALIALSFILAWTISPIAWQRIQAAKTEDAARGGIAAAAILLALFYAGIVRAGMLFLPLFPDARPANPLISEYIARETAPPLGGLIFVTVLAAILSTMAAAVNSGAFLLVRDLLRYGRRAANGGSPVGLGRASTVVIGTAAFLAAVRLQDILKTLGLASKIMAEGLLIPGFAALLTKRRAPLAGLLGLVAGGVYALLCFLAETGVLPFRVAPWPRSLPAGLALSAGGYVAGLALEKLKSERGARP